MIRNIWPQEQPDWNADSGEVAFGDRYTDVGAADWLLSGEKVFEWQATDQGARGKVHFMTTVDVTGETPADLPDAALCRLVCFFIVGRLSGQALSDAYESLMDYYSWQRTQSETPLPIPEQRHHVVTGTRREERAPITFEDD